jgi:hypothetical protein
MLACGGGVVGIAGGGGMLTLIGVKGMEAVVVVGCRDGWLLLGTVQ